MINEAVEQLGSLTKGMDSDLKFKYLIDKAISAHKIVPSNLASAKEVFEAFKKDPNNVVDIDVLLGGKHTRLTLSLGNALLSRAGEIIKDSMAQSGKTKEVIDRILENNEEQILSDNKVENKLRNGLREALDNEGVTSEGIRNSLADQLVGIAKERAAARKGLMETNNMKASPYRKFYQVQEKKASAYLEGRNLSEVYNLQLREIEVAEKRITRCLPFANKAEAIAELEKHFSSIGNMPERTKAAEDAWKLIGRYVESANFSAPVKDSNGFTDLYESAFLRAFEKTIPEAEQVRFWRNLRISALCVKI